MRLLGCLSHSLMLRKPRGHDPYQSRPGPLSSGSCGARLLFARQKSKLAGTIRGSFFVIKGEY